MFKKNTSLCLLLPIVILFLSAADYASAYSFSLESLLILGGNPDVPALISYFFTFAVGIGGLLAVVSLVIAGIKLIISAENPERVGDAKKQAVSAVVGLIIVLSSVIILNTINLQLKSLQVGPTAQLGGVWLMPGKVPAPSFGDDLDAARAQGFTKLTWTRTVEGIDGKSTEGNNCDPDNPNVVYDIYYFRKKGFQDYFSKGQLACGKENPFPADAKSYIMQKEVPGVYLFTEPNCAVGNDKRLPMIATQGIPELDRDIKSYCIVNGPDAKKGPFFGVISFNGKDYMTASKTQHFQPYFRHIAAKRTTYTPCSPKNCLSAAGGSGGAVELKGNSLAIYQWVGFDDYGKIASAGAEGVTLYSRPGWSGGYYRVSGEEKKEVWKLDLSKTEITYPAYLSIPEEEKKQCQKFVTSEGTYIFPYHCLQSIKIAGDYLVLVSDSEDKTGSVVWSHAQVFPISPRLQKVYTNRPEGYSVERGTPNLNADWITKDYANYVEIIPLAKPFQSQ